MTTLIYIIFAVLVVCLAECLRSASCGQRAEPFFMWTGGVGFLVLVVVSLSSATGRTYEVSRVSGEREYGTAWSFDAWGLTRTKGQPVVITPGPPRY